MVATHIKMIKHDSLPNNWCGTQQMCCPGCTLQWRWISNNVLTCVLQHAILLIKSALEYAVPDVPHEVASQMAKVEFQRREALKVRSASYLSRTSLFPKLLVENKASWENDTMFHFFLNSEVGGGGRGELRFLLIPPDAAFWANFVSFRIKDNIYFENRLKLWPIFFFLNCNF